MTSFLKRKMIFWVLFFFISCLCTAAQQKDAPKNLRRTNIPADNSINVAFVISDGATVIDFAGPWDVFESVMFTPDFKPWRDIKDEEMVMPFNLYTVAEDRAPITVSSGMILVPNYTFDNAPKAQVIVVPAQHSRTPAFEKWLKGSVDNADVVMSVCTGAFVLGDFGMLEGQKATTHAWWDERFTSKYPKVEFHSGVRYVENATISTSGGETSGIDLALRIVERYFGEEIAQSTADFMMYRGAWRKADSTKVSGSAGQGAPLSSPMPSK